MLRSILFGVALAVCFAGHSSGYASAEQQGCIRLAIPNARGSIVAYFQRFKDTTIRHLDLKGGASSAVCLASDEYVVWIESPNGDGSAAVAVYPGITRNVLMMVDPQVHVKLRARTSPPPSATPPQRGTGPWFAVQLPSSGYTAVLYAKGPLPSWAPNVYNATEDGNAAIFDAVPPGCFLLEIDGANFRLERYVTFGTQGDIKVMKITNSDIVRDGKLRHDE